MNRPAVVLFGLPFDAKSSHARGPRLAPEVIRATLHSGSSNWFCECGTDLSATDNWTDIGDLPLSEDWDATFDAAYLQAQQVLNAQQKFLALGGDHSLSFPLLKAVGERHARMTIVHLDAHPDLYDEFEGDRFSHACPFARAMEIIPEARLIQIGIRTATAHQRDQMQRIGVECYEASRWQLESLPAITGPIYLSLDMDVLDPAFAPGVSHLEPGGLSTRDVLSIIQRLKGQLVSADLVEFNPSRDHSGITAAAAAKFTRELLAALLT